jgi:hypothetical protein
MERTGGALFFRGAIMLKLCLSAIVVICSSCAPPSTPRPAATNTYNEIMYYQWLNATQPLPQRTVQLPQPFMVWEGDTSRMVWITPMAVPP